MASCIIYVYYYEILIEIENGLPQLSGDVVLYNFFSYLIAVFWKKLFRSSFALVALLVAL